LAVLASCAVALAFAGAAAASTVHVTTTASTGPGSLDQALSDVSGPGSDPSSTIIIDDLGPSAVIELPNQAFLPKGVSIQGPGADRLTIDLASHGFLGLSDLTLQGITLTGASGAPQSSASSVVPLIASGENIVLSHVVVRDNHAAQAVDGDPANDVFYDTGMFRPNQSLSLIDTRIVDNSLDVTVAGPTPNAFVIGGIVEGGSLTMKRSEISRNRVSITTAAGDTTTTANLRPGLLDPFDPATISSSSISDNVLKATSDGRAAVEGAIFFSDAAAISDSTIAGNAARVKAPDVSSDGAINAVDALSIQRSTISGNQGESFANVASGSIPTTVTDSIIANPRSGPSCIGSFVSGGFNLSEDGSCGLGEATDIVGFDPQLRPLHANGGPTETLALRPSSPAIDAGNAGGATGDQRPLPRPFDTAVANAPGGDGSDIGAFELQKRPECQGQAVTIIALPDRITQGTRHDDVILGSSGNDEIDGRAGNDTICGGAHSDEIEGAHGDDTIFGGLGFDHVRAGSGEDVAHGGNGDDRVYGGIDDDLVFGDAGHDHLKGNAGTDQCRGGTGADTRQSCES
jgi:Ca2+-binding RTX toxin-like protein